jgi:hypothetical protein
MTLEIPIVVRVTPMLQAVTVPVTPMLRAVTVPVTPMADPTVMDQALDPVTVTVK